MDIVTIAILLLVSVLILVSTNYIMQKRQAVSLEAMRTVEEERFFLELKDIREEKSQGDLIGDAVAWLAKQLSDASGIDDLKFDKAAQSFNGLKAVVVKSNDGFNLVASAYDKRSLIQMTKTGKRADRVAKALAQADMVKLLGSNPRRTKVWERNLLNAGHFLDLEAEQAGQKLNVHWGAPDRLYLYLVPAS